MWSEPKLVNAVREIASILERCGLVYWLDAGTLLSIRRDKSITGQPDFDIGALYEAEALHAFVSGLNDLEYNIEITSYESAICKVKVKGTCIIPIDIVFYQREQNLLISPQKYRNEFYRGYISGQVANYRNIFKSSLKQRRVVNIKLSNDHLTYKVGSWMLPLVLLSDFITCDVTCLRIPSAADAYLTVRYGDWRTPNSGEWVFSRDDGCFSKLCPSSVQKLQALMGY